MSALAEARALLERAVAEAVTPGAQLAVRAPGFDEALCAGALDYAPDAAPVTDATLFDLASVTKVATALAWVRVADRENIPPSTPLRALLPYAADAPAGDATLEALLSHRAGLVHWAPFYRAVDARDAGSERARRAVLDAVVRTPRTPPGDARYSDLGYILLGEALASATSQDLAATLRVEVLDPVGLGARVRYRGVGASWRARDVAPTERCAWRGRVVQGEVHDENAYALGGVAGHAGLFGTARDLASLGAAALACLGGDARWFAPERMAWMIAPRPGGAHRLGWDARSDGAPSSGARMGPRTFGHLGFTGASLWCDPDAGAAIALVTNRVHPTRDNAGIRALRPAVHDAVMRALGR